MDMFDCFVEKARDVCDAATKKTGELVEISKLKMECASLNGEIRRLYEKLGGCVYSMVKANYDNQDVIDGIIEEVDECKARLRELNGTIEHIKRITICPACGCKNPKESFYCARCGSRIKSEFPEAAFDMGEDFE